MFERFHLPALQRTSDWSLVAAVDPSADRRRWVSRLAPGAALAAVLGDLGDEIGLDAVLISSPPDTHCAVAAEVLRRHAHVLVEKPMALRAAEAASLVQVAGAAGRRILVGFNRRFRPGYRRLRDRLRGVPAAEIRDLRYTLRTTPQQWGALTDYLSLPERGGGLLDDVGSHQLDLLPWLVSRPVAAVRATLARTQDAAATATIDLRFADGLEARCEAVHGGGSVELLEVRVRGRKMLVSLGGLAVASWAPEPLMRGSLAARGLLGSAWRRVRGVPGYSHDTFARQFAAWAEALRGRPAPDVADGAAGARCVELVEACRRSAAVGGAWVTVPQPTEGK